jgi:hypothetical protein
VFNSLVLLYDFMGNARQSPGYILWGHYDFLGHNKKPPAISLARGLALNFISFPLPASLD